MRDLDEAGRIARANVSRSLAPDVGFPRNVFAGAWSDYFFFDPDWMRAANFVEQVQAFLRVAGGVCACLVNLERAPGADDSSLLIHERTAPEAYKKLLAGSPPGFGWLDDMSRLACAPDTGDWAMYAEPINEIAVVGFRHAGAWERYGPAMARSHAERLETAINEPFLSWSFEHLLPAWREEMRRAYAARSA